MAAMKFQIAGGEIPQRDREVLEMYSSGVTLAKICRTFGLGKDSIYRIAYTHGVRRYRAPNEEQTERNAEMARLYQDGVTLAEIGDIYGVTRERVRQLVLKAGVNPLNGGAHVVWKERAETRVLERARKKVLRRERYEARCWKLFGCSAEVIDSFGGYNSSYRNRGYSQFGNNPIYVYINTRYLMMHHWHARWEISFPEWWAIWEASGKWKQRGRHGGGYCLGRIDKKGPFTKDNVHVVTLSQNSFNTKGNYILKSLDI
jgi:transposase-like protein